MKLNYARVRIYDLLGEIEQVANELSKNDKATLTEKTKAVEISVNAHYARKFWSIPTATEKPPVRTAKATETTKGAKDEK